MGKRNKHLPSKITSAELGKFGKRVVVEQLPTAYYEKHPSWQFHRAFTEYVHGKDDFWGFPAMLEDAKLILEKLHGYDSRTWKEIFQSPEANSKSHKVKVANLAAEARRYLQEYEPGLDEVMSFRFGAKTRLYGKITSAGEFQALMWDRDHKVYPMAYQR